MNSVINSIKYFFLITTELTVLFLAISTVVALVLMHIPQEKIKNWMNGKGLWGYIIGAFVGALTPFCACSTIPLALGFLEAGITFGAVMSFIIASPLLNPIILAMLIALMGWQVSAIYFVIVFCGAVLFGLLLEKTGCSRYVKKVRITGCCQEETETTCNTFKLKLKSSISRAWADFKAIFIYLLIGVGIGAVIYGYLPQELVIKFAGPDNPLAIPIAAIIGIPLYIRMETAIPIGVALMQKGMNIGAVIALIIGGAGMAIPEMSMLAAIFKKKLVIAIAGVIFLTAVIGGYIFNMVL